MSRLHIIANPTAGRGIAAVTYQKVARRLSQEGVSFTSVTTGYPGHATQLAAEAVEKGCDCVIAVGGDGTVREVAKALVHTDACLAIIPCGTGNDLARPLMIPKDPLMALDVALHGQNRLMDAGLANGELFFNVAGFGFDVDVLDYTELYKGKTQNGSIAYLRGLFAAIRDLKLRRTTITTKEGVEVKNVLLLAAGNGRFFGGGMEICPKADPFDGMLDICIGHDVNKLTVLSILPRFLKGKHLGSKYVSYFRTTELTAVCEPESRLDIDGEVMPSTPLNIQVLPGAVHVMVPAALS